MLYTTLNKIREISPCEDGWKILLTHLNKTKADDEQLDFKTIIEAIGIEDTLWCLKTQEFKDYYKFCTRVAYSVLPLFEEEHPEDKRPRLGIEAVEKFMKGEINIKELEKAISDAAAAVWSACAAARAAYAAGAAGAAAAAARAAYTAGAAAHAAEAAAHAAAEQAKWKEIEQIFVEECLN